MAAIIQMLAIFAALLATALASVDQMKLCPTVGVYTVANPKSCSKYYICFNHQLVDQECATGLTYDRDTNTCMQSHLTQCRVEICPIDEKNPVSMVASPDDCGRYYICSRGIGTIMQCPSGLLFNRAIGTCDLASNVVCFDEEEERSKNEAKIVCPATGFKKIPHPKDCTQYSICLDGKRMDYRCQNDLHYDTRTQRCNFADISKCFA